jgi:uncharacterized DUF497 family protein
MLFEWDDAKARRNLRVHGVDFRRAARAFEDYFAVSWIDASAEYGEERICHLGMVADVLLFVVYVQRGDTIRIVSARRAEGREYGYYHRENSR